MSGNADWKRILGLLPITTLIISLALYFYTSIVHYVGAGRDDTFITLWTGITLAEGHGLVNYNFEPVEMSSSLLHTVIVAITYILAPNFIYTINKVLGLMAGAILLVVLYQKRHDLFERNISGITMFAITSLGLANNRAWLYWNLGGLETPFQTLIIFLYGLYLVEFMKTPVRVLPLVVLQILYILVRPEGFILILFTTIFIFSRVLLHKPFQSKQVILLIGVPSLLFLLILIVRYLHFGLLFPNPVYAKIYMGMDNNTVSNINTGIEYLKGFYTSSPYVAIQLAVLTALVIHYGRILIDQRTKADPGTSIPYFNFAPLLGLILINHLFVISVGGDWMEFFRLIVPVVPFLVILTTCFAFGIFNAVLEKHILSRPHLEILANLALGVLFLVAIATNSGQRDNYEIEGYHNCSEKMDLRKLHFVSLDYSHLDDQLILVNCAGKRDWNGVMPFITAELPEVYKSLDQNITIATYQMGFFPYFIKRVYPAMNIEFIDTVGLADSNIARMQLPKKNYGVKDGVNMVSIFTGKSGELSRYVLGRNPNMIYVLDATNIRRQALIELGWSTGWDNPGAVIFIKKQPE